MDVIYACTFWTYAEYLSEDWKNSWKEGGIQVRDGKVISCLEQKYDLQ